MCSSPPSSSCLRISYGVHELQCLFPPCGGTQLSWPAHPRPPTLLRHASSAGRLPGCRAGCGDGGSPRTSFTTALCPRALFQSHAVPVGRPRCPGDGRPPPPLTACRAPTARPRLPPQCRLAPAGRLPRCPAAARAGLQHAAPGRLDHPGLRELPRLPREDECLVQVRPAPPRPAPCMLPGHAPRC